MGRLSSPLPPAPRGDPVRCGPGAVTPACAAAPPAFAALLEKQIVDYDYAPPILNEAIPPQPPAKKEQ